MLCISLLGFFHCRLSSFGNRHLMFGGEPIFVYHAFLRIYHIFPFFEKVWKCQQNICGAYPTFFYLELWYFWNLGMKTSHNISIHKGELMVGTRPFLNHLEVCPKYNIVFKELFTWTWRWHMTPKQQAFEIKRLDLIINSYRIWMVDIG